MRPLPPNLRSPTILTPTLQMDELRRSADASARELGIVPLATDATQRDAVVTAAQESGFLERGMASPPRTAAPRRLGISAVGRPTPERKTGDARVGTGERWQQRTSQGDAVATDKASNSMKKTRGRLEYEVSVRRKRDNYLRLKTKEVYFARVDRLARRVLLRARWSCWRLGTLATQHKDRTLLYVLAVRLHHAVKKLRLRALARWRAYVALQLVRGAEGRSRAVRGALKIGHLLRRAPQMSVRRTFWRWYARCFGAAHRLRSGFSLGIVEHLLRRHASVYSRNIGRFRDDARQQKRRALLVWEQQVQSWRRGKKSTTMSLIRSAVWRAKDCLQNGGNALRAPSMEERHDLQESFMAYTLNLSQIGEATSGHGGGGGGGGDIDDLATPGPVSSHYLRHESQAWEGPGLTSHFETQLMRSLEENDARQVTLRRQQELREGSLVHLGNRLTLTLRFFLGQRSRYHVQRCFLRWCFLAKQEQKLEENSPLPPHAAEEAIRFAQGRAEASETRVEEAEARVNESGRVIMALNDYMKQRQLNSLGLRLLRGLQWRQRHAFQLWRYMAQLAVSRMTKDVDKLIEVGRTSAMQAELAAAQGEVGRLRAELARSEAETSRAAGELSAYQNETSRAKQETRTVRATLISERDELQAEVSSLRTQLRRLAEAEARPAVDAAAATGHTAQEVAERRRREAAERAQAEAQAEKEELAAENAALRIKAEKAATAESEKQALEAQLRKAERERELVEAKTRRLSTPDLNSRIARRKSSVGMVGNLGTGLEDEGTDSRRRSEPAVRVMLSEHSREAIIFQRARSRLERKRGSSSRFARPGVLRRGGVTRTGSDGDSSDDDE